MSRRSLLLLPGLAWLPALGFHAGGWATITVEELPDYAVAGQPLNLAFTVRQHGRNLLDGLRAGVEARSGDLATSARATETGKSGRYAATLTLPKPGEWTITIQSGFGDSRVTLLPLKAVNAGAPQHALPEAERGRRLFVAKACVTCHVHAEFKGNASLGVGPELTDRRYTATYLTQFLANPAIAAPAGGRTIEMPNLGLKPPEIAALVAFINAERHALP